MSNASESHNPQTPQQGKPKSRGGAITLLIVVLIVAVILAVTGVLQRVNARTKLESQTTELAAPDVLAAPPTQGKPTEEVVLPGNIFAYVDSPIYARTNGYLKKWYFDIGAHVKQGQLLAEIESPEVDQQLAQAKADLLTAQANLELASITKTRYQGLLKTNAVSQQDVDNAVGTYNANKAIVEADKAAVEQF